MQTNKLIFRAGIISIGSLVATQLIRFAGNIFLTKFLAPSAFGVVGIVNMIILGISLVSDLGLRQVVIQRQGQLSQEFLNTIWSIQIARGFCICLMAVLAAGVLLFLQRNNLMPLNAYSDHLLPYLIAGAASSAIFQGLESTKSITERRSLNLGRISAIGIASQLISMAIMIFVAKISASPWALTAGAISSALLQCVTSHYLLPGERNHFSFVRSIAKDVLKKSKWILLSSPLTFLQSNTEVIILGGLVNSTMLGNYMIAYLLVNVVHQVSGNLAGNVIFPGLSAASRVDEKTLKEKYMHFQLISDAIIVTASGGLIAAGDSVVSILFDHRYASSGQLLSCLAIGLIGIRYHVIEEMLQAQGNFRLSTVISLLRLLSLATGTYVGFHIAGLQGAAVGVGVSWFAGWPILLWHRAKAMPWPWKVELAAIALFTSGYLLGLVFTQIVRWIR